MEQQKNLCEEKRISLNKLNLEGVIVFFLAVAICYRTLHSHQLAPLHTNTLRLLNMGIWSEIKLLLFHEPEE